MPPVRPCFFASGGLLHRDPGQPGLEADVGGFDMDDMCFPRLTMAVSLYYGSCTDPPRGAPFPSYTSGGLNVPTPRGLLGISWEVIFLAWRAEKPENGFRYGAWRELYKAS